MMSYELLLNQSLRPSDAYRLYAMLLEQIPSDYASALHMQTITPINQYVNHNHWHIHLMDVHAIHQFSPCIEGLSEFSLNRLPDTCRVLDIQAQSFEYPQVWMDCSDPFNLKFVTPTAFKSAGKYQVMPTPRLIFNSLLQKWNTFWGESFPIPVTQALENAVSALCICSKGLRKEYFVMKGNAVPGAVGELEVKLGGEKEDKTIAMLLNFSQLSGIGIKTSLGMGGIQI